MKKKQIILVLLSVCFMFLMMNFISSKTLIERTGNSNIYDLGNGQHMMELYPKDINMFINNEWKPYEDVTYFGETSKGLIITWKDKYIELEIVGKTKIGDKTFKELKENFDFKTTIEKNVGSYYYDHRLNATNIEKIIYKVNTNAGFCTFFNNKLKCGDQEIDFNEAVNDQNLDVTYFFGTLYISGDDLSYIDPSINLGYSYLNHHGTVDKEQSFVNNIYTTYNYYNGGNYLQDIGRDEVKGTTSWKFYDRRGYFSWETPSSLDNVDITDVDVNFRTGAMTGTVNTLKIYFVDEDDVSDLTPDTVSEAQDLYNELESSTLLYTLNNPTYYKWYDLDLGSSGNNALESAIYESNEFILGFVTNLYTDEYIDIYSSSTLSPYLEITYTAQDTTPPTTSFSASGSGSSRTITLTCSDSGSGCDYTRYCYDTSNSCSPGNTYSSPFTVTNSGSSSQTYYVRYWSRDNAGNSESTKSTSFTIGSSDTTPPTTTQSVSGFNSPAITVTLSCYDSGSGCASTKYCYSIHSSGTQVCSPGTTYSSPFTITNTFNTQMKGTFYYYSIDNANNQESSTGASYFLAAKDTTPPVTTATATSGGKSYTFGTQTTEDISVVLSCYDNDACDDTYWCIDNTNICVPDNHVSAYGNPTKKTSIGKEYLRFYSADVNTNKETTQSVILEKVTTITSNEEPNNTSGGSGRSITNIGEEGSMLSWEMSGPGGSDNYEFKMIPNTIRKQNIEFKNTGQSAVEVTLTCDNLKGAICEYVEFEKTFMTLPLIKNLITRIDFEVNLPEEIPNGDYIFNIIGTDQDGQQGVLSSKVIVDRSFLNQILTKFVSSFKIGNVNVPYFLLFLLIVIFVAITSFYSGFNKNQSGITWAMGLGLVVGLVIMGLL